MTDVTADPTRLPAELRGPAGRIACLADARPLAEYARILAAAGLTVVYQDRHDAALAAMIDQIGCEPAQAFSRLGSLATGSAWAMERPPAAGWRGPPGWWTRED
jgi:hypothetical protein